MHARTPPIGDPRLAVRFLTRIPVPARRDTGGDLTAASAWFPAVGIVVAAVVVGVRAGAQPLVGVVPATVAAVLAGVLLTGALHEDGLADTADAVWGGATVERRLEILRDSRLGTFGVTALVGELGLRTALLAGLALGDFVRATVAAHVLGRLAPLVLSALLPPARTDGQGARTGRLRPAGWVLALGTVAVVLVPALQVWATAAIVLAAAVVAGIGVLARRRLGGIAGDLLGAAVVVTGLSTTVLVTVLSHTEVW